MEKVQCVCCCVEVSLDWEHQVKSLGKRFTLGGLAIKRKCVWCLAIATKYKGLGGVNRCEGGRY